MQGYRIFQGKETQQIDGHTMRAAEPERWYFEPSDYEGDVLWSASFPTEEAARSAAAEEDARTPADEENTP